MKSFFVPDSSSKWGRKYRNKKWDQILHKQLELAYYANISIDDSDELAIFELNTLHDKLKEIKEKEKENIKEAKKKAEQEAKNK